MRDLWTHIGLFLTVSVVIVVIGAFYAEADDRKALRSLPRRLATFVIGCAVLAAILLVCERLFASAG